MCRGARLLCFCLWVVQTAASFLSLVNILLGEGIEVVVVGVVVSSPAGPCSVVWCLVSMSACAIISVTGSVNPWMSVATNTLP